MLFVFFISEGRGFRLSQEIVVKKRVVNRGLQSIDADNTKIRQALFNGKSLCKLLLIRRDQTPGARIGYNEFHLRSRNGREDAHIDRPDVEDGKIGNGPLRPILREKGYPVPLTYAEGEQGGGQHSHLFAHFPVRDGLESALDFTQHCRVCRKLLHTLLEHLTECLNHASPPCPFRI